MSSRFVAGMTVEESLKAAEAVNREGIAVSLDSLGESVLDVAQAEASAAIYHRLIDEIETRGLKANVSVKLTQMGMDLDPGLAERIVGELVEHANAADTFVRIDMEGAEYTEATIAMTERLHARFPGRVGLERVRSAVGRPAWTRSRCARARLLSSVFQLVRAEKRMDLPCRSIARLLPE